LLKNTDQDLLKLKGDKKNNSGQYEVILRRYKSERKPVCLRIYGIRRFETSEFKNIILLRDFPPDKLPNYDDMQPTKRDMACQKKYDNETPTDLNPQS
jgi:hypothetical protein